MTTITDLPFETLSSILEEAAKLNLRESPTFTYGLTEAPEPLRNTRMQIYVRGMVPPDILRWDTTDSIRQVHRIWHYWALDYSFKELYIRRWRGSERWLESHEFKNPQRKISSVVVYRDSFRLLKNTAKLLTDFPEIASHVRRVWFNGFYVAESSQYIFDILRHCTNLRSASLPWTAMRHGQIEGWARLLDHGEGNLPFSSLELLAVDLKGSQKANPSNGVDNRVTEHQEIDFGQLTRLKMFGNTNFNPICNGDLKQIAKTARNLREIHITGMSSISIEGRE
ncbi:hypothetical protein FGG08_001608 [Glutinoglossum americanum]|uniref:Uncharacterized protein n=1 Tax=Glutinoglossum americanum TaxID=1670608 RepID=A0A9P8IB68_9PEZI|nr:hypothetical protein FGG08_001608 [Glutinoglossum americanum]